MKKRDLINLIREIHSSILKEGKYRAMFSVEHGSGNTAKEWKDYIKNIPGVKVVTSPSSYKHHTDVYVVVDNKAIIPKILKKWKNYGINWPEATDFKPYNSL